MSEVSPEGTRIPDKFVIVESSMSQFEFSEEFIKKRNKLVIMPLIIFMPIVFLLLWMTTTASPKIRLFSFVLSTILIAIIVVMEARFLNKSMRQIKLLIYKDKLVKNFGKGKEVSATWSEINKIKLVKNPKGHYGQIIIYRQNRQLMRLFGFRQMEEIAGLVQENVPSNTNIVTTQRKIDPENPILMILGGVTAIVILTVIHLGGSNVEDIFSLLLTMGLAVAMLIFKPVSKSNPNLKKFEAILGWMAMVATIFMLIVILWPLLFKES